MMLRIVLSTLVFTYATTSFAGPEMIMSSATFDESALKDLADPEMSVEAVLEHIQKAYPDLNIVILDYTVQPNPNIKVKPRISDALAEKFSDKKLKAYYAKTYTTLFGNNLSSAGFVAAYTHGHSPTMDGIIFDFDRPEMDKHTLVLSRSATRSDVIHEFIHYLCVEARGKDVERAELELIRYLDLEELKPGETKRGENANALISNKTFNVRTALSMAVLQFQNAYFERVQTLSENKADETQLDDEEFEFGVFWMASAFDYYRLTRAEEIDIQLYLMEHSKLDKDEFREAKKIFGENHATIKALVDQPLIKLTMDRFEKFEPKLSDNHKRFLKGLKARIQETKDNLDKVAKREKILSAKWAADLIKDIEKE